MRSPASYHRVRNKMLPAMVASAIAVLCTIVFYVAMRALTAPSPWRQSVAFVTDSTIHVVSWDATREHVVVIDMPSSSVIEGTHGYGAYPAGSLLTLDTIDRHQGRVFLESLSDAFGLPITGYVRMIDTKKFDGSISLIRSYFSWASIFQVQNRQHIGWINWVAWVIAAGSLKVDQVTSLSVSQALVDQTQPDGSVVRVLDPQRLDFFNEGVFMDTGLRTEGITVSIYNTTDIPTVGQRVARILSQTGISVVSVGNEDTMLVQCEVRGNEKNLRSRTVLFIRSYFGCVLRKQDEEDARSDVSLRLGIDIASRY